MRDLGLTATLATSGHHTSEAVSLQSSVKLIRSQDLHPTSIKLGSGKFGTCQMVFYSHFKACKKIYKRANYNALCNEANVLSKFTSRQLPYLFGICIAEAALIVSFHGFCDRSITLHSALGGKSAEILANYDMNWKNILLQIFEGINELHSVYKVLHNDIKSDNVVLEPGFSNSVVKAVIIDFGKACNVDQGRHYHLSSQEREEYKVNHPHIAPDVRDGLCSQCTLSDIFSFGRIILMVATLLEDESLRTLSKQCLQYNSSLRPCGNQLKQSLI